MFYSEKEEFEEIGMESDMLDKYSIIGVFIDGENRYRLLAVNKEQMKCDFYSTKFVRPLTK